MRRIVGVLFLIVIIESWGILGAWRTAGIRHTCTVRVGPLCYSWEATAIGKLLGDDGAKRLDDALKVAKADLEKNVIEKVTKTGKDGLDKMFEEMKDMAEEGLDSAKKMIER